MHENIVSRRKIGTCMQQRLYETVLLAKILKAACWQLVLINVSVPQFHIY